jgi:hypothetical protein
MAWENPRSRSGSGHEGRFILKNENWSVTWPAGRHFGISRKTGYKILTRYRGSRHLATAITKAVSRSTFGRRAEKAIASKTSPTTRHGADGVPPGSMPGSRTTRQPMDSNRLPPKSGTGNTARARRLLPQAAARPAPLIRLASDEILKQDTNFPEECHGYYVYHIKRWRPSFCICCPGGDRDKPRV